MKFKNRLQRNRPGSVRISNRIATAMDQELYYEAEQRHAEVLMKDICIGESSKGVVTPGAVSTGEVGAMLRMRSSTAWGTKPI